MSLDTASYAELWRIYNETGVLPEHILPTLYFESGFDPSLQNLQGAQNFGLNQASTDLIASYAGVDPQTYQTWPASKQLATVVRGFVKSLVARYGRIGSATRFEQANFYPLSMKTAHSLDDVIVSSPSKTYRDNVHLDKEGKGAITVADLARVMTTAASSHAVQSAIANTYAAKNRYAPLDIGVSGAPPVEPPMMAEVELVTRRLPPIGLGASPEDVNHIVYGDDFGFWQLHPNLAKLSIAASILTASYLVVKSGWVRRWL